MSHTNNQTRHLTPHWIPHGDIYLHAGDFTNQGRMKEVENFKQKAVITCKVVDF